MYSKYLVNINKNLSVYIKKKERKINIYLEQLVGLGKLELVFDICFVKIVFPPNQIFTRLFIVTKVVPAMEVLNNFETEITA